MTERLRAPCGVCGRPYTVRTDGRLREHKSPSNALRMRLGGGAEIGEMAKLRSGIAALEANMAALRSSIAKQREYITELEAALSTHLGCATEELRASFEIGDTNSEIQGRPPC